MDEEKERSNFMPYFKKFTSLEPITFDYKLKLVQDYSMKYGLNEEDFVIITKIVFKQKLGVLRLKHVFKALIPRRFIPDESLEHVILYLLVYMHQPKASSLLKLILQWLIGVMEFKLVQSPYKIDLYYDFFYSFMKIPQTAAPACKLLYMLSKITDVSRWYVKQVLRIHLKDAKKKKYTGALLYRFKTYRPDFVPEYIPPYADKNAFGKLPLMFINSFTLARTRIDVQGAIPRHIDEINWINFDSNMGGRKKFKLLIPNIAVNELHRNILETKSLFALKTVGDLSKYRLSKSKPNSILSLLNHIAGFYVLIFGDEQAMELFSYQLFHVLQDAFIDRDPLVHDSERIKLLQKLATFQNLIRQPIPVVSRFIGRFIISWDGLEFEDEIYNLMEWLHFSSFMELKECVLDYLYDIFMYESIETKCKILQYLANLTTNIIMLYFYRNSDSSKNLFLTEKTTHIDIDKTEYLEELYNYVEEMCTLGLLLGKGNSFVLHTAISVYHKILVYQEDLPFKKFKISSFVAYTSLFSSNPNALEGICKLFNRFPECVPPVVRADFIDCLINQKAFATTTKNSIFENCDKVGELISSQKIIPEGSLYFELHPSVACYDLTCVSDNALRNHALKYYPAVQEFVDQVFEEAQGDD